MHLFKGGFNNGYSAIVSDICERLITTAELLYMDKDVSIVEDKAWNGDTSIL
ncbi:Hypothetical protein I595_173 [Croceitalea dokdonensis DOKDO 023]|uniref:Uncharacterized protein n=1 Tax=Croceitalea dokdonensis DOKDO 023 TaxID=1300341 RepID=A0A0P7AWY2_9FLAO|nr:hypothetical protein [Croceitalea dokdonensis]KPM33270.1 Hypothetical protein I595_173 [Croceitalea dokdonensis DOKDO 023]